MSDDPVKTIFEMTEAASKGRISTEADLIRYFISAAETTLNESIVVPPGDDAAVLKPTPGMDLVTTADMLIESVDFDFAYSQSADVGYKSVMVNISDLVAMRANPRWLTVSLGLKAIEPDFIETLTAGFILACKETNVALVGGDISSAPCLTISVNAMGEVEPGKAVTRSGAEDRMLIAITGPVGSSYAGYRLLTVGTNFDIRKSVMKELREKHCRPKARFDLLPALLEIEIGAMIDISDGFLKDLRRILQSSNLSAEIALSSIPISDAAREAASKLNEDPLNWALKGGEEFELILCLRESEFEKLISKLPDKHSPPVVVGKIIAGDKGKLKLYDKRGKEIQIDEGGFDHFRDWKV